MSISLMCYPVGVQISFQYALLVCNIYYIMNTSGNFTPFDTNFLLLRSYKLFLNIHIRLSFLITKSLFYLK